LMGLKRKNSPPLELFSWIFPTFSMGFGPRPPQKLQNSFLSSL
jgi:hypothetical protein